MRFKHVRICNALLNILQHIQSAIDNQSVAFKDIAVVVIKEQTVIRKIADLGKPGTVNHTVELEVKFSRRQAIHIILPFVVASMFVRAKAQDG